MADLKFHCPECDQRLAVDESAAGMQIDCPSCLSGLVIPMVSGELAKVVKRRRAAAVAGRGDSAYEELERKQNELSVALEEAARLRGEGERSKSELARLREEVAESHRTVTPVTPVPPAEDARLRRENEALLAKLSVVETARDLLAARIAALEATPAPLAPAAPSVEALGWKQQLEDLRRDFTETQVALTAARAEREGLKLEAGRAAAALQELEVVKANLRKRRQILRSARQEPRRCNSSSTRRASNSSGNKARMANSPASARSSSAAKARWKSCSAGHRH